MTNFDALASRLAGRVTGKVRRLVALSELSRWRIGGPAELVVEPASAEDLRAVLTELDGLPAPVIVIGDGSNLLFDDAGLQGVVIRIGSAMSDMKIDGEHVWAQSGVWVPHFARRVGCAGLTGIEHIVGIPGTLGGLVLMNGGSQRRGIGENLVSVRCMDMQGNLVHLTHEQCAFSYRHSSLQGRGLIVLDAEFRLSRKPASAVRREMVSILSDRRRKFPKQLPNCGSVFLSNPSMYADIGPPGHAIEQCGLKGTTRGNAQISPHHANFIVNLGGAKSSDVLWLIDRARSSVFDRTGFWMDCEVRHVLPTGVMQMAHLSAQSAMA